MNVALVNSNLFEINHDLGEIITNKLSILSIENVNVGEIDFEHVIGKFAAIKSRKVQYCNF